MASETVYLRLAPKWAGNNRLTGFNVVGTTKNRPVESDGPIVKLTLRIPDRAFRPIEVEVDVPELAVDYPPVVNVEMPDEPEMVETEDNDV